MKTSINKSAAMIVEIIIEDSVRFNCMVDKIGGTAVIDTGIKVPGTDRLGQMIAEICMGGVGSVRISREVLGNLELPVAIVATAHPKLATLCSQFPEWRVEIDDFVAVASGPAKALIDADSSYSKFDCQDDAELAVVVLDTREIPTSHVLEHIADTCGVDASNLFCVISPSTSRVGSIRAASRVIEYGMHRLHDLGFDIDNVRSAYGVAPIPPVADNDHKAIELAGECIRYGGRVFFYVRPQEGCSLKDLAARFVSQKSADQDMISSQGTPARITITDIETQDTYTAGFMDCDILKSALNKYEY